LRRRSVSAKTEIHALEDLSPSQGQGSQTGAAIHARTLCPFRHLALKHLTYPLILPVNSFAKFRRQARYLPPNKKGGGHRKISFGLNTKTPTQLGPWGNLAGMDIGCAKLEGTFKTFPQCSKACHLKMVRLQKFFRNLRNLAIAAMALLEILPRTIGFPNGFQDYRFLAR